MLASLFAALKITGWAGEAGDLDPGRPGVPDFGRKLYHPLLPKPPRRTAARPRSEGNVVAMERKAGQTVTRLEGKGNLRHWSDSLGAFRRRLREAHFAGAMLDYDATVVDSRSRFRPPTDEAVAELSRILHFGGRIGVATGRGVSVRRDLRTAIPSEC